MNQQTSEYWAGYPVNPAAFSFVRSARSMLIDGDWRPARSGGTIDVQDPGSDSLLTTIPDAAQADVDDAVAAARRAFDSGPWPRLRPAERERLLLKLADLVEQHADELAHIETFDNGKPLAEAREDVDSVPGYLRYMAGWATKIEGSTQELSLPWENFGYTRKEAIGVVAAIVPWNYPFSMAAWKIAPCLVTGCTIVLKPSEQTSLSALRLGELIVAAGYPAGVVNIITGYGAKVGTPLVSHPQVDKIAFTGSTSTGKLIGKLAMDRIKRVTLELGGKSPMLVLADADIARIVPSLASAIFHNQGQICTAGSRLYVHASRYEQVVAGIADIARTIHLAHGFDPACQMGPMVSPQHRNRVVRHIDGAIQEGARVAARAPMCDKQRGYFVAPTVLVDVRSDMACVQEEIFGPVLVIAPFDDDEQALRLANDTQYGLAASIWSNDLSKVHRMLPKMRAGIVWVNTHNPVDNALPFGGIKQSGIGRELGRAQLDSYLETKSVLLAL